MPSTVFILADSSIELLPESLYKNNLIKKYAKKRNKDPSQTILDSNYHYKAMYKLEDYKKRGRPDILHFCLLNLLGSTLIKSNLSYVKILVHTINDILIEIKPETRLPKNYNRFIGLMEQLLAQKNIKKNDLPLINILGNFNIEKAISNIPKKNRLIFTSKGNLVKLPNYLENYKNEDIALIVGAFPHGNFSNTILNLTENRLAIYPEILEAWIVLNQIIFSREITMK